MGNYNHVEHINGKEIPFKIFLEKRRSVRVSFGRSCINLRIPSSLSNKDKNQHFNKALTWVKNHIEKNPDSVLPYILKDYLTEKSINIYDTEILLSIKKSNRATGRAKYLQKKNTIEVSIPESMEPIEENKMIKKLLSRVTAQIFKPAIEKRVHEINNKCFHKEIKSVNLKYNKSNWGSCSSALNINLSTRLLFAPKDVIDYVIIHELAHLYEMNHSSKFWDIVYQVMPDYKEKEHWLKINGSKCDF